MTGPILRTRILNERVEDHGELTEAAREKLDKTIAAVPVLIGPTVTDDTDKVVWSKYRGLVVPHERFWFECQFKFSYLPRGVTGFTGQYVESEKQPDGGFDMQSTIFSTSTDAPVYVCGAVKFGITADGRLRLRNEEGHLDAYTHINTGFFKRDQGCPVADMRLLSDLSSLFDSMQLLGQAEHDAARSSRFS